MGRLGGTGRALGGWAVTTAVSAALAAPAPARAGNDDAILLGSDAALTGGAVTATSEDGAATYYNPAGIAHVERGQVNVSAQAIQLQNLSIDDLLSVDGGGSVDGSALVIPMLPAGVTYGGKLSDTLSWGGGISVQNQFAYTLRNVLDFARADPASLTVAVEQREINTVGGVDLGWRVRPNLRLGIAVMGRFRERYGSAIVSGGTIVADPTDPPDEIAITVIDDSYGSRAAGAELRAGLQWEPSQDWVVGAAVWTPTFNLYQARQTTASVLDLRAGGPDGDSAFYVPVDVDETRWGFDQASSWRFRTGVAYRARWGWVALDADVQPAFESEDQGVDRQLVLNVRAGGQVRVGRATSIGVGLFTDRTSVPRGRTGGFQPRVDLYGGTVGFEYDDSHRLADGEAADEIRFRTGSRCASPTAAASSARSGSAATSWSTR